MQFTYPLILPTISEPSDTEKSLRALLDEGIDYHEAGDLWRAEKIYRRVLAKYPKHPRALNLLGLLEYARKNVEQGRAMMSEASDLDPTDAVIHANRAMMLYATERWDECIEASLRAIEQWPGHDVVMANMASPMGEMLRHEEGVYALENAVRLNPTFMQHHANLIFLRDLASSTTPEQALAVRRSFNEKFIKPHIPADPVYENDRSLTKKLRIGYFSADFYQHSAVHTYGAMFLNFDKQSFEVYAYGDVETEDTVTESFKRHATVYRNVKGWSDDKFAAQVRADKIDIFVDLGGFTARTRLGTFARRPAPVQVSGWGYATGTGLDSHDYFFADETTVPIGEEDRHHEEVWRLPCILSWVKPEYMVDVPLTHSVFGRPFTIGSFTRMHKITIESIDMWADILKAIPGSRLVIKNNSLRVDSVSNAVRQALIDRGVYYADGDPDAKGNRPKRVVLALGTSHAEHMVGHGVLDVLLDPYPHGGGVSTFETLWMGVPIVTRMSERISGRITASILKHLGLDSWITHSHQEYVDRVVQAAADPLALAKEREGLRERLEGTIMLDQQGYCREVESAYREMWRRWVIANPAPESFLQPSQGQDLDLMLLRGYA